MERSSGNTLTIEETFSTITAAKGIGAVLVILIHITAEATLLPNLTGFFATLINQVARPAVPFFIFLSGFALSTVYRNKPLHIASFYRKRIHRILPVYVLFSLFYYLFRSGSSLSPEVFLKQLILGSSMYHLYFIVIILQFYLLFPFLHSFFSKKILFLSSFVLSILFFLYIPMPYKDRIFLTYLPFFSFGMLIATKKWVINPHFLLLLVPASVFFIWQYHHVPFAFYYYPVGYLLASFAYLQLAYHLRTYVRLQKLGKASFTVYLVHPVILSLPQILFPSWGVLEVLFVQGALIVLFLVVLLYRDNERLYL